MMVLAVIAGCDNKYGFPEVEEKISVSLDVDYVHEDGTPAQDLNQYPDPVTEENISNGEAGHYDFVVATVPERTELRADNSPCATDAEDMSAEFTLVDEGAVAPQITAGFASLSWEVVFFTPEHLVYGFGYADDSAYCGERLSNWDLGDAYAEFLGQSLSLYAGEEIQSVIPATVTGGAAFAAAADEVDVFCEFNRNDDAKMEYEANSENNWYKYELEPGEEEYDDIEFACQGTLQYVVPQ